jgi:hypothetical protein
MTVIPSCGRQLLGPSITGRTSRESYAQPHVKKIAILDARDPERLGKLTGPQADHRRAT